jgi:hypothetical protein
VKRQASVARPSREAWGFGVVAASLGDDAKTFILELLGRSILLIEVGEMDAVEWMPLQEAALQARTTPRDDEKLRCTALN